MAYKANGAPCDLMRENILLNSGSFSATANSDSGDFRTDAITMGMPTRLAHVTDATAYAAPNVLEDNWLARCRWGWTPANKGGDGTAGSLT